jgi:hypothetical protein
VENTELRQRLSARAHRRLVEHFSPAEYDRQLFEIYDTTLKGMCLPFSA